MFLLIEAQCRNCNNTDKHSFEVKNWKKATSYIKPISDWKCPKCKCKAANWYYSRDLSSEYEYDDNSRIVNFSKNEIARLEGQRYPRLFDITSDSMFALYNRTTFKRRIYNPENPKEVLSGSIT